MSSKGNNALRKVVEYLKGNMGVTFEDKEPEEKEIVKDEEDEEENIVPVALNKNKVQAFLRGVKRTK